MTAKIWRYARMPYVETRQASWIRRLNMHAQKIYAVAAFCFMSFAVMGAWVFFPRMQ